MPGEKWQLHISGHKIVGKVYEILYDHCHRDKKIEYWKSKGRIIEVPEIDIDWQSHKKAMSVFGPRKHWVTKHFSGWAGSGVNMLKWGFRANNKCPRCEEPESTLHVIQCKAAEIELVYWGAVAPLGEWLVKHEDVDMQEVIMDHIHAYREQREAVVRESWSDKVKEASVAQSRVGYRSLAEELPVVEWRCIAQTRNVSGDAIEKGLRWTSAMIRKCWEVSWDMWVERNDLVHHDGEVRDILVLQDINTKVRELQQEGSTCRLLHKDDRRFFKTPFWKIRKKTEQQKLRYIETATRLLDDQCMTGQQTLRNWRTDIEEEGDDSDGSSGSTSHGVGTTTLTATRDRTLVQTTLQAHFGRVTRQDTDAESINRASAIDLVVEALAVANLKSDNSIRIQPSAGDVIWPLARRDWPMADPDDTVLKLGSQLL